MFLCAEVMWVCRQDGLDLAHYSLRMFFVMFYCVVCCDPSKASVSSVTVSGNTGYTALHESCIRGEIEVACILADAGAKMDTVLKVLMIYCT